MSVGGSFICLMARGGMWREVAFWASLALAMGPWALHVPWNLLNILVPVGGNLLF